MIDHQDSLIHRLRRLRQPSHYHLLHQSPPQTSSWIHPIFIATQLITPKSISSLPGHYQWPLNEELLCAIEKWQQVGVQHFLLFGQTNDKDEIGTSALSEHAPLLQAVSYLRQHAKTARLWADLCLCPYTSHGHCGVFNPNNSTIDNHKTLVLLGQQALLLAKAGVHGIAPSGMMDGVVGLLRQQLDANGYDDCLLMAYSCKYASEFYGPFREAMNSAPKKMDRSSYQMDPSRPFEAMREAELDDEQGADIIMVKPAGYYLDVITRLKQHLPHVPLAAYHVSGEYAALCLAADANLLRWPETAFEVLTCIKRAGADLFIHYFLPRLLEFL